MKKILFTLFSLIIFTSCQKDEIIDISEITQVESNDIFNSLTINYSLINKTTGKYKTQYYITNHLNKQDQEELYFTKDGLYYIVHENDMVVGDFDNDGKRDLFGFATWNNNQQWGSQPGLYYLILDYFNGNREKIFYDSEISFGQGGMELNDINGDGIDDIIFSVLNRHQNEVYNINLSEKQTQIITISHDLKLSSYGVGTPVDTHDVSTGDIDNDGDIDLINYTASTSLVDTSIGTYPRFPKVLLNNGSGQFNEYDLFINQNELFGDYSYWGATVVDMFDLNNDGNLDVIVGNLLSNRFKVTESPIYSWQNYNLEIFWGDGTGQFDLNNKSTLKLNTDYGYGLELLGIGYTDSDDDGNVDLVLSSTRAEMNGNIDNGTFYHNYLMFHFKNNGDGTFDDTTNLINGNVDLTLSKFSTMYNVWIIDKDSDGDYDIIPGGTTPWTPYSQIKQLWWENVSGVYIRRELK